VDMRRLSWIMLAAGVGMVIMVLVRANIGPADKPTTQPAKPAGKPAQGPTSTPATATAPATSRPATGPASRPASQPATAGAEKGKDADNRDWEANEGDANRNNVYIGSLDPDSGYMFEVQFNTAGAAIHTVKLSKHYASVYDKRRVDDVGWAKYRQALAEGDEELQGSYCVLNPVVSPKGVTYYPLATRDITVTIPGQKGSHPWRHDPRLRSIGARRTNPNWRNWKVLPNTTEPPEGVQRKSFFWEYTYTPDAAKAALKPVVRVIKTYEIRKNDYTIYVSMRVENAWAGDKPIKVDLDQAGPTGVPKEDTRGDLRKVVFGKYSLQDKKINPKTEGREDDVDDVTLGKREDAGASDDKTDPVAWIGQTNKFFGAMLYLVPTKDDDKDAVAAAKWGAEFYHQDVMETKDSPTQMTGLTITLEVASGADKAQTIEFELFAGPKYIDMFTDEDHPYFKQRYETLGYKGTLDLRSCFCVADWMSLAVVGFLGTLASWATFGNYGMAIIILVIIVRLLLHPLTKKGQVMMSKMKKLGPMMKELEKKYADDKEALAREKMKLFKTQGASPLLGCLPMLLQMPILIALWSGINASIDLRHAAFLPVWIIDLAAPDKLFRHGIPIPYFGEWLNLMPLLLGVTMYWQMKFSPQAQTATSEQQEQQQKMMKIMMPLMMPFMFYHMASGLTLYFLASTFFGAAEQSYIRKAIEAKEALEAATTTTVQMPGRGPRGSRPRKPKGPMRFKKG